MTDGIFKKNRLGAYARAAEIMSTQSKTDFEWSVKLIGNLGFSVGIASHLEPEDALVLTYDENAIVYNANYSPVIVKSRHEIHQNLPKLNTGDVIKFRFEPQRKKLVIDLVRIRKN